MRTALIILMTLTVSGCCPGIPFWFGAGPTTGFKSSGTGYSVPESELLTVGAESRSGKTRAQLVGSGSETEYGFGVQAVAGRAFGTMATTGHVIVSYDRYAFDGGHDRLLRLGVQARHRLGQQDRHVWVGGEVGLIHDKTIYDDDLFSDDPSARGFALSPLVGYRIPLTSFDVNLFTGVGLIHFGDFKSDGFVVDESGNSLHVRFGVELMVPLNLSGTGI